MKALVVYESMFGNTATIAVAIAEGLKPVGEVQLVDVGAAPTTIGPDIGLVVVGGPTHAFGMSRTNTRRAARRQGAVPSSAGDIGIREWLEDVRIVAPGAGGGPSAAAFDTRLPSQLSGSAARSARRRLRQLGLPLVTAPTSFAVGGTTGPLLDGEVERARRWGSDLAAHLPGEILT